MIYSPPSRAVVHNCNLIFLKLLNILRNGEFQGNEIEFNLMTLSLDVYVFDVVF